MELDFVCLYALCLLLLDGTMQHTLHAGIFYFCISIYFPSHPERRMERGLSLWSRGVYHKVGKWVSVHPPLDTRADERTFEAVWLFLLRSLSLLFVYMASSIGFLCIVLRLYTLEFYFIFISCSSTKANGGNTGWRKEKCGADSEPLPCCALKMLNSWRTFDWASASHSWWFQLEVEKEKYFWRILSSWNPLQRSKSLDSSHKNADTSLKAGSFKTENERTNEEL